MALSKKGELKGWTPEARDAKLSHLIDVINDNANSIFRCGNH
jgi:hypothetical protein